MRDNKEISRLVGDLNTVKRAFDLGLITQEEYLDWQTEIHKRLKERFGSNE